MCHGIKKADLNTACMKKSIILYILAVVLITASIIKIISTRHKHKSKKQATTIQIFPAEGYIARDTIVSFELNTVGTIRAYESTKIVSEISKRLVSINFTEGTFVQKGKVLFKLDDADLIAKLVKLRLQEELAQHNEERHRALLEKGGISKQAYDEAENTLKVIQAEIQLLEVELDKTEIRAPFSGKIGLRYISEGAFIMPKKILTNLLDVSRLRIDLSVPERYANNIFNGMEITFTVPAIPRLFKANIKAIEPNIDLSTRNLEIMAVVDNQDGLLFAGSTAKILLKFQEKEKSIYVPTQCLVPSPLGYRIYILNHGKADLREITTGIRAKEYVQLLDGVKSGDTLVMTNLLRIRPGSVVQINKFN